MTYLGTTRCGHLGYPQNGSFGVPQKGWSPRACAPPPTRARRRAPDIDAEACPQNRIIPMQWGVPHPPPQDHQKGGVIYDPKKMGSKMTQKDGVIYDPKKGTPKSGHFGVPKMRSFMDPHKWGSLARACARLRARAGEGPVLTLKH